jgi:hypothetical protein
MKKLLLILCCTWPLLARADSESIYAGEVKAEYEIREFIKGCFGAEANNMIIMISNHHITVDFYQGWWLIPDQRKHLARMLAMVGFIHYRDSTVFDVTVKDQHGEDEAFVQRSDIADLQTEFDKAMAICVADGKKAKKKME